MAQDRWWEAYPVAAEEGDALPASDAGGAAGAWQESYPAAPEEAPRPQRSFGRQMLRRAGLGVRDVVEGAAASLPGMVYDAAAAPMSLVSLALGGGRLRTAGELATAGADAVGLPRPENATERVQSRIQREVTGMGTGLAAGRVMQVAQALPGAAREVGRVLAEAPGAQAAGAVASGAAGAGAREAGGGDLADLAASIPAGVAGAAGYTVARRAASGAAAALAPLSDRGRRRIAGNAIIQSARDPEDLAGRLARADETIPGVRQTSAEVAGDEGLFSLERTLRNTPEGTSEFAALDAARDQARRRAIAAIEPVEGAPPAPGQPIDLGAQGRAPEVAEAVRGRVTARFERLQNEADAADRAIAARRAQLPLREPPEASGAAIRSALDDEGAEAARRTSAAYEAIDPEDVTRLPLSAVRAAADGAERRYWGPLAGRMPPELRSAVDDLAAAPDAVSWRDLQSLRARLGALMDHPDERVQATAARMRRAIDETAESAALPWQPAGAPRGLGDLEAAEAAEGLDRRSDVREVLANMGGATRERREAGNSLVQFLRQDPARAPGQARGAFGGIRDSEGHLRAILDDPRRMPGLIDRRGRSYEQAMQAAIDAGYYPGRTLQHDASNPGATLTLDEFLSDIADEIHGRRRVFPRHTDEARRVGGEQRVLREAVDRELDETGVSLHDDQGAIGRAVRPIEEDAPRAPMDRPDGAFSVPEDQRFTPEQAAAWRTATEAQRDEGARFLSGPVGDVRRRVLGRPVVPDSGVPQRFFRAGSGSPEAADQFIAAVGGREEAVRALEAYATRSLEDYGRTGSGGFSAERMRRWMDHHAEALKRFPDLRRRLGRWIEAQARREDVDVQKVAWTRETESGAFRAFLHMEPEEAVASALRSANAEENIIALRGLLGNHPGAVRALRRAYLDAWVDRARGPVDAQMRDRLSPAQARRWVQQTERAGRALFEPEQWSRIQQIERDIASGQRVSTVGRAAGSNTVQNASTAYFLAQLTGGLAGADALVTRVLGGTAGRILNVLAAAPAEEVRRLLIQAAADPALARALVLEATPKRAEDAARHVARLMDPERLRSAAVEAGLREAMRAGVASRAGEDRSGDQ